jgi:hypothetical protein
MQKNRPFLRQVMRALYIESMKEYLPYLTVFGSVVAFLFTAFKYFNTQRLVEENKRFEQFHKVFEWVAGRTSDGKSLVDIQQAMAVYQLSEFPEYGYMSIPIIDYYLKQTDGESDDSLFRASLLETKRRLEGNI